MKDFILKLPSFFIIKLIEVYQATLSPDHGLLKARYPHGYCRHYPSCSQYSKQAVLKYGAFKGVVLAVVRIVKCNPFNPASVDLVK